MTSNTFRPLAGSVLAASVLAIAALAAGGPVRADDDAKIKPVKLAAETQEKLGFKVQPLAAAAQAQTVSGFVRVLDAGPLAQLDADIQGAEAAAEASAAEAARAKALNADGQAVSTKALEAAQAQARTDAAKVQALRRRVGLEWGDGLARLPDAARARLIGEIAAGRSVLVRIDTPSGRGLAQLHAVKLDLGARGAVLAQVLGAARSADPHLLSSGVIARVTGPAARTLSAGLALPVRLSSQAPVKGVVAPQAALVRSGGKTWVYVRTSAEQFLRKPADGAPMAGGGGLFVADGLKAGEAVVTTGAAALFTAESNVGEGGGD